MMSVTLSCDNCVHYVYNEDYESYECLVSVDEDEYYSIVTGEYGSCPYYRNDDEYGVVKKQM